MRINKNGEAFTRKDQISYITDSETLENHVGFGRANLTKQSVFYGAIPTPKIEYPRATAYFETTDFFSCKLVADNFVEIFTSGRWFILEDIPVMEMIFSDEALKESDYAQASLKALPEIVDKYLKLEKVAMFKFENRWCESTN